MRRLTAGEAALARAAFGAELDPRGLRIATLPFGGWAVCLGPVLLFPSGAPRDFAAAPDPGVPAWFVHELTHAWQWRTRPLWTVASWLKTLAAGGYGRGLPGYRLDGRPFARCNLEQQARQVERAWLEGARPALAALRAGP